MDKEISDLIELEFNRQENGLELIASENYCSKDIRNACGSILTYKYAEGYPFRRYYGGCEYIDKIEQIAIDRACKLFSCKFANVQPHSGSQANAAAYKALERYLEKRNVFEYKNEYRQMRILAMQLNDGGHLTHSSPVSFVSNEYEIYTYSLDKDGKINMNLIESKIIELTQANKKPDVILTGYSAYPYEIDFSKFRELANKYNCLLMVDMAHIAGLVAAGKHMSPIPYADIVTTTTHKTLRGPRGGLILTNNEELIKLINSAVFPYYQGGPLEHIIAGKAICFKEAMQPKFRHYIKSVLDNTKAFTLEMKNLGAICSNTENHLTLLNTKKTFNLTGLDAQIMLEDINITTNKNMLPGDSESPRTTSGLRIGFAALTTRGCTTDIAIEIADIIFNYLSNRETKDNSVIKIKSIIFRLKSLKKI